MRISSNAQWVEPDVVVFAPRRRAHGAASGSKRGPRQSVSRSRLQIRSSTSSPRLARCSARLERALSPTTPVETSMQLVWAHRNGNESGTIGKPADYAPLHAALSRRAEAAHGAQAARPWAGTISGATTWSASTEEQLTFGRGSEVTPVWIDGERAILFAGDSPGSLATPVSQGPRFRVGKTTSRRPGSLQLVMDVLPGGRAVRARRTPRGWRLQALPTAADGRGIARSPAATAIQLVWDAGVARWPRDRIPRRSARGATTVPLHRTVSCNSEPHLAATEVRSDPRWSADSRQLYHVGSDRRMMTVPVRTGPPISFGIAQPYSR